MSRTYRVYLHADSRFHQQNREEKGRLKQRAMRVLIQRTKEALMEVNDPSTADVCFNVYQREGEQGAWMLRKVKV